MKSRRCSMPFAAFAYAFVIFYGTVLHAQEAPKADDAAELAKKLSNPVAALISVPFQNNFDFGSGSDDDGFRYQMNLQPVIPISLNDKWTVISRTILPIIYQDDVIGDENQSGLGDTAQSFFFSPKEPTAGGLIWGVGPIFQVPTATDDLLGGEKWGIGPTAVFLKQEHGWTYGALLNHVWSVAGEDDRDDVSATFIQPFLSYTNPAHTTYTLNSESTYDWEHEHWTVPINFTIGQLLKIGGHPISLTAGARYYVETPAGGPEWGLRFVVTLLFPK